MISDLSPYEVSLDDILSLNVPHCVYSSMLIGCRGVCVCVCVCVCVRVCVCVCVSRKPWGFFSLPTLTCSSGTISLLWREAWEKQLYWGPDSEHIVMYNNT